MPQLPSHPNYHHQAVRDLAWVLDRRHDLLMHLSPAHGLHWHRLNLPAIKEPILAWFKHLDQKPEPLIERLGGKGKTRLGGYFEDLLDYCLRFAPDSAFEVHERNLPLRNPQPKDQRGTTLGELDFLLTESGRWIHLEVAVKFYLGLVDVGNEAIRWVGPNNRDRWDLKLQHMREHQLPLSRHMDLPQCHHQNLHREFCVKGYLFHPWPMELPLPPGTQAAPVTAWWVHWHALQGFLNGQTQAWRPLARPTWLSGTLESTCPPEEVLTLARDHFQHSAQAIMFSAPTAEDANGRRLMVVADSWPSGLESLR